jgi:hypothetical protein
MGASMSKEFDDLDDELFPEKDIDEFAGLTSEQYDKLMDDIENFNNSFFSHLAGTANYEIIPTETEDGVILQEEHYKLIKKEIAKTGATILYSYKVGRDTVVINPRTLKTVVLIDGEAH